VIALCSLMGTPTTVGPDTDLVVWDVRPRPDLSPELRAGNVSVTDGEAQPHTDSAFSPTPEPLISLWCVRPAQDGGASVLIDARAVLARMAAEPAGRAAIGQLTDHDVPLSAGGRLLPTRVLAVDGETLVMRYRPDLMTPSPDRAGDDPAGSAAAPECRGAGRRRARRAARGHRGDARRAAAVAA
jgi:Taurine catabolism dioxygenase TauD, TfdA family